MNIYRWHCVNFFPELSVTPMDGNQSVVELTVLGYVVTWVIPVPFTRSYSTPAIGPYWSRKKKELYF